MCELTREDLKTVYDVMESVLDIFGSDQIKDYPSVVHTFNKVGDIVRK